MECTKGCNINKCPCSWWLDQCYTNDDMPCEEGATYTEVEDPLWKTR